MAMLGVAIFSLYGIFFLVNYWNADINYALGYNYQQITEFSQANPYLEKAVAMRGGEDLYKNELSVNLAALSIGFAQQKDVANTTKFATRAKELSDQVSQRNPNNVVYWKARTRVMFSLAQLNPAFINDAIAAIEKAHQLATTDAKITYNQALIYDQAGQKDKAIAVIDETIKLKPNYREAYYAKALFLSGMIEKEAKNSPKIPGYKKGAIDSLNFILQNILPNDEQAKNLLKTLE
jgi:tetratricopeptide (TPR) repeat protein